MSVILFQISVDWSHFEKLKVIDSSIMRAYIAYFSVISRVSMLNLIYSFKPSFKVMEVLQVRSHLDFSPPVLWVNNLIIACRTISLLLMSLTSPKKVRQHRAVHQLWWQTCSVKSSVIPDFASSLIQALQHLFGGFAGSGHSSHDCFVLFPCLFQL